LTFEGQVGGHADGRDVAGRVERGTYAQQFLAAALDAARLACRKRATWR
jgi:hypothetical protein